MGTLSGFCDSIFKSGAIGNDTDAAKNTAIAAFQDALCNLSAYTKIIGMDNNRHRDL